MALPVLVDSVLQAPAIPMFRSEVRNASFKVTQLDSYLQAYIADYL